MGSNLLLVVAQEYIKRIPHLNCVSGGVVHVVDLKQLQQSIYAKIERNGIFKKEENQRRFYVLTWDEEMLKECHLDLYSIIRMQ